MSDAAQRLEAEASARALADAHAAGHDAIVLAISLDRVAPRLRKRHPDRRRRHDRSGAAPAEAGAEGLVLAGAVLCGYASALQARLAMPVLDGVQCAVQQCRVVLALDEVARCVDGGGGSRSGAGA